jgi:hypothetical protein
MALFRNHICLYPKAALYRHRISTWPGPLDYSYNHFSIRSALTSSYSTNGTLEDALPDPAPLWCVERSHAAPCLSCCQAILNTKMLTWINLWTPDSSVDYYISTPHVSPWKPILLEMRTSFDFSMCPTWKTPATLFCTDVTLGRNTLTGEKGLSDARKKTGAGHARDQWEWCTHLTACWLHTKRWTTSNPNPAEWGGVLRSSWYELEMKSGLVVMNAARTTSSSQRDTKKFTL